NRRGRRNQRWYFRQIEIRGITVSAVCDAVGAARDGLFLEEVVAGLANLIGDLVATANRRFPLAEPWQLPCKSDCRTKIVVIVFVPRRARVRRVLADVCTYSVRRIAHTGLHPVAEARSRNTPDRRGAA